MAKENVQTKGEKEIGKKARKIKEKIMNKSEDMVENEQKTTEKMEEKPPQKIDLEMAEKEPKTEPIVDKSPAQEVGTDELVSVLKIPMADAKVESEPEVHSALFDSPENTDPEFEDEEEEENLNDKYFKEENSDDFDSEFFEDETLMAEMGVEIIDLGMQTLAMGIAQDFDNPEKYAVSEYKKKKIKKPLELLLRKRGAKVSPEIMFGVVLLVVYAPTLIMAVQERKEKMKAKKNPPTDIADQIPEHVQEVREQAPPKPPQEDMVFDKNSPPPLKAEPMVIPVDPIKKKGRPKGSKDTKKRAKGSGAYQKKKK